MKINFEELAPVMLFIDEMVPASDSCEFGLPYSLLPPLSLQHSFLIPLSISFLSPSLFLPSLARILAIL